MSIQAIWNVVAFLQRKNNGNIHTIPDAHTTRTKKATSTKYAKHVSMSIQSWFQFHYFFGILFVNMNDIICFIIALLILFIIAYCVCTVAQNICCVIIASLIVINHQDTSTHPIATLLHHDQPLFFNHYRVEWHNRFLFLSHVFSLELLFLSEAKTGSIQLS